MRLARKLSISCYGCNKVIDIGDLIYSRNASSSKSKSKLYHEKCAERFNIL